MDKKKVLEALNQDLEHEMAAIVRYLHHSQAQDSMQHAIKLGEKIVALGGHPSVKVQEVYEPGEQTIEEMIAEDLEMEKAHLDTYEQQLDLVADNTALRLMLEQILVEETAHVEELELYLGKSPVTSKK